MYLKANPRTFIPLILLSALALFSGCQEEGPSVPNTQSTSLKRVYILYTGSSGATDYACYDVAANTITDEVYKNSNGGKTLNTSPGEMKLNNNRDLYITAAGQFGSGPGTLYKINTSDNSLSDSARVNWNPYGFVINNNNVVVSNLGGSTVSKFDLDFNSISDSINVGTGPTTVIYGMFNYVVSKHSAVSEKSLAFVNEYTSNVTKLFFPAAPVSTVFNLSGFFVSASSSKMIFRIDSESLVKLDSFAVPTSQPAVSDLIFKTQSQFYTTASSKEIWKAEITETGIAFTLIFPSRPDVNILNAAYESTRNEIYIAHGTDPFSNGRMIIINAETGNVRNTYSLGGKSPVRFAFMY